MNTNLPPKVTIQPQSTFISVLEKGSWNSLSKYQKRNRRKKKKKELMKAAEMQRNGLSVSECNLETSNTPVVPDDMSFVTTDEETLIASGNVDTLVSSDGQPTVKLQLRKAIECCQDPDRGRLDCFPPRKTFPSIFCDQAVPRLSCLLSTT